ncbi:hypothetical protein JCM5350_005838 [Sporobolomyces pararoseus]
MNDHTAETSEPRSPSIIDEQVDSTAVRITCDFEFNAFERDSTSLEIPVKTRSGHKWKISISGSAEWLTLELSADSRSTKDLLAQTDSSLWFCICQHYVNRFGNHLHRLDGRTFPRRWGRNESWELLVRESDVRMEYSSDYSTRLSTPHYRVIIEYKYLNSSESAGSRFETAIAPRNSQMYLSPSWSNVALSFVGGRRLWTDSSQLCSISDYFSTCLSSDFAESKVHSIESGRAVKDVLEPIKKKQKTEEEFEDSDDEGDRNVEDKATSTLPDRTSLSFQEIAISHAAFVTYRALLIWNRTGFLRFAPLTSSFLDFASYQPVVDAPKAQEERQQVIDQLVVENPSLPDPVSPKSMYRLAAFLDLEDLKERSLVAYAQRLSPQGAIHELLSKESSCYPDIRDATLKYIASKSETILKSGSYDYLYQQLQTGRLRDPTIFAKVLEAVSSAGNKPLVPSGFRYSDHSNSIDGVCFP